MSYNHLQFIPQSIPEKTGFNAILEAVGNYIHTPGGMDLLSRVRPASDRERVGELTEQTSEMLFLFRQDHSVPFSKIDEISEWLNRAKAEGTVLGLESFPSIRAHAGLARILRSFFEKHNETSPALWTIASELQTATELENEISRTVSDQGSLTDNASPELKAIRNRLTGRRHALRSVIGKMYKKASSEGKASDEGPTIRNGRMVIPIQAEYKRKVDGFVHDVSASGQTVYLEPVEALQVNNDIRHLEAEERRETERILEVLTTLVRKFRPLLTRNRELLGELDLIHARTRLGLIWDGVIPHCSGEQKWLIIEGRNPILLLKNRRLKTGQKAEEVVPLDLEITRQEKGLLISGPNAGGKSVALKTVGILAIMYQSGIPLPLQPHSELPVISGLFLDMGDEQSIENDLSTFSSRLKWMKDTLQKVDGNSLVLIDEAGTGTDPHEGGALFQAFMEILLDHQANLIATTHHSALKVFAHDHPLLANGAMEFDQETLTPTYRFRKGIPGSSYAFEIAGRMKLPPDLLRASRKLLGSQRDRMAELLLDLEQRLQDTEESRRQYEDLRKKAGKQEEVYNEKIRQLEEQRNSKLNEAYQEADRIMKDANRMIEQAVENISMKGKTDRDYVRAERRRVSEHKKKIRKRLAELNAREDTGANRPAENGLPEIGDRVRISGGNTTGELIEKEGNRAVVMAGGLKIKTRFGNLEKAEASGENKADRWKASSYTKTFSQEPVSPSLDLRGMRGEEAIRELMLYLDRAIAGGLNEVQVIHGKGEGILKKLVHEYLDKRKEVRTFGMAPWERGGPGCTEVSFE